ncbi:all-trans retinoic acid-induced differentiation factor-like [Glandiceps talaboti]
MALLLKLFRPHRKTFKIILFFITFIIFSTTSEAYYCHLSSCQGPITNSSVVYNFCQTLNNSRIDGRCCIQNIGQENVTVGIDLQDCNITHLEDAMFENVTDIQKLVLVENPLTECPTPSFQGLTLLNYLVLPPTCHCPGEEYEAWEKHENHTNFTLCQNQIDICNTTFKDQCHANSYCMLDGPGLTLCLCSEDYHGYKCLHKGSFPYAEYFGILGIVTVILSLCLWVTQRRMVLKKNN